MGILVMPMINERIFLLIPIIAMQVKVPMIVEKTVASTAMVRVFTRAEATASSDIRFTYQFRVKPPHFALDLLELKDKTIKVTMGAYIKIKRRARYTLSNTFFIMKALPVYQILIQPPC
jgi:hypothetical protein